MREKWPKQMPLMAHILDHPQSQELEVISVIIDTNPTICEQMLQDLKRGKSEAQRAGAKGMNAKNEKKRKSEYVDLLKITSKVLGYARSAVEMIKNTVVSQNCVALLVDIEHYAQLTEKVIDQTHRRVVLDQKVAAADKVVSIFEPAH